MSYSAKGDHNNNNVHISRDKVSIAATISNISTLSNEFDPHLVFSPVPNQNSRVLCYGVISCSLHLIIQIYAMVNGLNFLLIQLIPIIIPNTSSRYAQLSSSKQH